VEEWMMVGENDLLLAGGCAGNLRVSAGLG